MVLVFLKATALLVLLFFLLFLAPIALATPYITGSSGYIVIEGNNGLGGEYLVDVGDSSFSFGAKKVLGSGDPECFFNGVKEYACSASWSFCTLTRSSGSSHINLVYEFVDFSGKVIERGNLCSSGDSVTFDTPEKREYKFVEYNFDCFQTCRKNS